MSSIVGGFDKSSCTMPRVTASRIRSSYVAAAVSMMRRTLGQTFAKAWHTATPSSLGIIMSVISASIGVAGVAYIATASMESFKPMAEWPHRFTIVAISCASAGSSSSTKTFMSNT